MPRPPEATADKRGADPDNLLNWVWEIAAFLGLAPGPVSEEAALQPRRSTLDLSGPVRHVLERTWTQLLLVDGLQHARPEQLASALHYFDSPCEHLNITTIFCGTGAREILPAARADADSLAKAHEALSTVSSSTR